MKLFNSINIFLFDRLIPTIVLSVILLPVFIFGALSIYFIMIRLCACKGVRALRLFSQHLLINIKRMNEDVK